MIKKPEVGDVIWPDGRMFIVTSVTPILSKGDASGRVVEVKIEGYTLGLRYVPYHEREFD